MKTKPKGTDSGTNITHRRVHYCSISTLSKNTSMCICTKWAASGTRCRDHAIAAEDMRVSVVS